MYKYKYTYLQRGALRSAHNQWELTETESNRPLTATSLQQPLFFVPVEK